MTTTHHAEPATLRDARAMIHQHERSAMPRLRRLWSYFRNELRPALGQRSAEDGRWYRLGQEEGLPARILGYAGRAGAVADDRLGRRREVVIENDIAWRIQTMVDFLFGKPVRLSAAGAAGCGRCAMRWRRR